MQACGSVASRACVGVVVPANVKSMVPRNSAPIANSDLRPPNLLSGACKSPAGKRMRCCAAYFLAQLAQAVHVSLGTWHVAEVRSFRTLPGCSLHHSSCQSPKGLGLEGRSGQLA